MLRGRGVLFLGILFAVLLGACTEGPGEMVLSKGDMEDVLYDVHFANAISNITRADSVTQASYFDAVLEKHHITRAEFDSSMVYYMRRADILRAMYDDLEKRIDNDARLQGLDSRSMVASNGASSDTTDIWNLEKTKVLDVEPPFNTLAFHFKADSTFKAGDQFLLRFNCDYIYQEGMRNGYAVIVLKMNNDSIVTRTSSLGSAGDRLMEISDNEHIGVKEIKGYFMHRKSTNALDLNSSTVKMMIISNIALIKIHMKAKPDDNADLNANENKNKDSININNEKNINNGTDGRPPKFLNSSGPGMH